MNETSHVLKIKEENYSLGVYIDPFNKRIRVDDYFGSTIQAITKAESLAAETKAEKLIFKGRKEDFTELLQQCFQFEAVIDRYFLGSDAYIFSKYYTDARKTSKHWITEDHIIQSIYGLDLSAELGDHPKEYVLKRAEKSDAGGLAGLYKEVFEVYPVPLHNPQYIVKSMEEGTVYFCFEFNGKIVSAASAEINSFYKNAELTDCATLKEHRKHGLMKILLKKLEEDLKKTGIFQVYTIARALSFGMNAAFHQLGYKYRGRLMNNCYIFDKLENMNVWSKNLSAH